MTAKAQTNEAIRIEGPDAEGVAVLWLDVPGKKVNTLSVDLMPAFEGAFETLAGLSGLKAVVIASGKETGFIAGADIDDLNDVDSADAGAAISRKGQEAMDRLAGLAVPTVAAIHGDCLGGGLELALACDARICTEHGKTKLALPEVMLGLLPGAGGTTRLPALIGLPNALDMMLTGKNIRPRKAQKMGLVDDVVPPTQLIDAARAAALRLAAGKGAVKRKEPSMQQKVQHDLEEALLEKNPLGRQFVLREARKKVMAQSHGLYPAPLRILDVLADGRPQAESRAFGELLMTPESVGLRHLFRCITALKKDDGPGTEGVEGYEVERVGMIGAGLMGSGIATVLADKEVSVRLKDLNDDAIRKSLDYADRVYKKAVRRKKYKSSGRVQRIERISGGTTWAGFGRAQVVIEAVLEDLSLKQRMVSEVEAVAKGDTIFASNTSSLPISEIAAKAKHPERVIGMHFFSPVEKMPLVEVIVTDKTDPKVTKTTVDVARLMGKHVIVVGDGAGFYTTRVLAPYMNEAIRMLSEGYRVDDIDEAAIRVGFPVGPITLLDEVGIDVGSKITEVMKKYFGDRMVVPTDASDAFVKEGRFGRKSGKGFYKYEDGKSVTVKGKKVVDEDIYRHLPSGTATRSPDYTAMAERLMLALVGEAVRCLEEDILRDPMSGDLGAVMGIGFPPFRGGPFRYVDSLGAKHVVRRLESLAATHGDRFTPCDLLQRMGSRDRKFYD